MRQHDVQTRRRSWTVTRRLHQDRGQHGSGEFRLLEAEFVPTGSQ